LAPLAGDGKTSQDPRLADVADPLAELERLWPRLPPEVQRAVMAIVASYQ
jgi:hypothetical protein